LPATLLRMPQALRCEGLAHGRRPHTQPPLPFPIMAVQYALRHPHVVRVYGAFYDGTTDPPEAGVVMELCTGGALFKRLHPAPADSSDASSGPSLRERLTWALQTMQALAYLHTKAIKHMDVKSDNVLLDGAAAAKVADFGLSVGGVGGGDDDTAGGGFGLCGSPVYMCPSLLDYGPWEYHCDVYSMGVLLWECVTCRVPYDKHTFRTPLALFAAVHSGVRPATPDELTALAPAGVGALIANMWNGAPPARPAMRDAMARLAALVAVA